MENLMKNKKGIMLNQAFNAVMSVVVVGVLVIIAIFLFVSLGNSVAAPNTAGAYVNETITPTAAGVTLAAASLNYGTCGAITKVYNGTSATVIDAGNYTQVGCLVKNASNEYPNAWKVSYPYTYTADTSASNASNVLISNFSGYPALVGLIGTIIFLGIIIGVLVASFYFGKSKA